MPITKEIYKNKEIPEIPFPEIPLHDHNGLNSPPLAPSSVDTIQIATGAVTNNEIADETITDKEILDRAITNTKIAVDAIYGDVIKASAITETKIANNSISTPKLQAASITTGKIAAGAVTAEKISVDSLSAISANIGNITAGNITGVTIIGSTIKTSTGKDRIEMNVNYIECFQNNYSRLLIWPYGIVFKTSTGIYVGEVYGNIVGGKNVIYFSNHIYVGQNIYVFNDIISGGDISSWNISSWNIYCNKVYETGCPIEIDKKEAIEDLRKIKGDEKFIPSKASKQLKTNKYRRIKYDSLPDYALLPTDKYKIFLERQLKEEISEERKKEIQEQLKEFPEFSVNKDALSSMIIFAIQDIDERLQKLEKLCLKNEQN